MVFVWHARLRPHDRTISSSTQVQGGDFNLYENQRCHGVPLVTISRGRLVCENGVFMCAEGSGRFCPLRHFPDFLYKRMIQREKVTLVVMIVKLDIKHFLHFLTRSYFVLDSDPARGGSGSILGWCRHGSQRWQERLRPLWDWRTHASDS